MEIHSKSVFIPPSLTTTTTEPQSSIDVRTTVPEEEASRPVEQSVLEEAEEFADDMSSVLTQFRNRRDYEKKNGPLAENFDRVLEEDVLPKAEQIIAIARLAHIPLEELMRRAHSQGLRMKFSK